jgi:hypothetical protein
VLELPEMAEGIYSYTSDIYNFFDFSMPIFFIVRVILRLIYGKIMIFGEIKLLDNLIKIFIIIASTLKVL